MRISCTFLLGLIVFGVLFAVTPAPSIAEGSEQESTQKERPAWAIPSHAIPKSNYNADKYAEESPAEWEFLGYTAKELHDRYDPMSRCQPEAKRFWFGGCGGIEGGTFIEVKYGADDKVTEARCCYTGCTYTHYGKYFGDRNEAIKYAIARCTKNLQEHFERKKAIPGELRRQLKTRARAYTALGNAELAALDLKHRDLLLPVMVRYDSAGDPCAGTIHAPLGKLSKEFARNGFQMQRLSARKYKFFKPKGPSFVVTANSRQIVPAEEAVWFLQEEIEKEAVQILKSASSPPSSSSPAPI